MGPKLARPDLNAAIARLSRRPHGLFTVAQAELLGVQRRTLSKRVASGRLHRIHRGVLSVVPPELLSFEARCMAAVLAYGGGAVVSHLAAAALWGLRQPPTLMDVTVPGYGGRQKRPGLRIHRSRCLFPTATTSRDGIPVTTPERTLFDLRRVVARSAWGQLAREATLRGFPLNARLADPTRSELEARFLAFCRRHSIPKPAVNAQLGRFTVDFLWEGKQLVVETDGWETHGTRSAFEGDRSRDAALQALGSRVARFTWRQIAEEPAVVVAVLRSLLALG